MNKMLTRDTLRKQNLAFVGTGGVSAENRASGFSPAFYDAATGRAELARFADGRPAPMHLLDGLPETWVAQRDACGHITATKQTVRKRPQARLCGRSTQQATTGCPGGRAVAAHLRRPPTFVT